MDKVVRVMSKTSLALLCWPVIIWEDFTRLECHVRGKDHEEYK